MTAAGWPQRFEVRFRADEDVATYRVVTWAGPAQAEVLAREAHGRRHPDAAGALAVEVAEVEPPGRTERGTVALEPGDVVDRQEF